MLIAADTFSHLRLQVQLGDLIIEEFKRIILCREVIAWQEIVIVRNDKPFSGDNFAIDDAACDRIRVRRHSVFR